MFLTKLSLALIPATLVFTGVRTSAQAHVTENQSTYIYVDATYGSDGNSGTQNSALKTIQAAVNKANANNRKWVGSKVIIKPGVYRETVTIGNYQSTSAPITFEAAIAGTAIISGSNVLTGWSQENSTTFSHVWTPNFGTCAIPAGWSSSIPEIARRTELIFVNGIPLTQVLSYSDLQPGTFFVNESSNMLHVMPPTGTDMWTATVEAAERTLTLNVSSRTNLVFRGLVFRHAANCINTSGAIVNGSSNILFDADQAVWNNWGGIGIYGTNNVTVQNSIASHNGGVGFQASQDQNVLYNYNESDYNNWRGAQGALYDWGMGGTKLMRMRNTSIQNHFSYRNQAQGLWFDTDNKNITINNATLSQNVLASLQIEANEGPITLENSHLCSSGLGVNVINSEKFTIQNNTFYNNSGASTLQAEIFIAGKSGGRQFNDWLTGQSYDLYTSNMVLSGNTFENASYGQKTFGTFLSGNDWNQFAWTLHAGNNKWFDPNTTAPFELTGNKLVSLGAWKSAVGTDSTSSWAKPSTSPAGACSAPSPTFHDFAVNLGDETISMSGGHATSTVLVNSFDYGAVSLKVTGLPSGVWSRLSQSSLVNGTVPLTLSANSSAGYKTVPVTIWATSGSRVHSVTFNLHVTPS